MLISQWLQQERMNSLIRETRAYSPLPLNTAMQPVASVG